jgi:error-prone DNA polymerase
MATFKFTGGVSAFKDKLVDGMVQRGYAQEFAERTFTQLEGFGSYGFPESHAASFALIAYASSWMKCWHPDVFCTALLNSQPMGFYAPAQIVRDAQQHGVEVRPICVQASHWDCTLEPAGEGGFAVRLGLRMVRGLANADAARLVAARADKPFASVAELWRRSGVAVASLTRLAEADAFRSAFGLHRREASWAIRALRDAPLPLFQAADEREQALVPEIAEPAVTLPPMTAGREVVEDYGHLGLTLREHPVAFLRAELAGQRFTSCAEATAVADRRSVRVAGLVLVRQMPGSAKGVMFITIEDETGVANLVVWPSLFERQWRVGLSAGMLGVDGEIQSEGEVVHVVVRRLHDLTPLLASVGEREATFPLPHGHGDEARSGGARPDPREKPQRGVKARDIYVPDLHIDTLRTKTRDFR